MWHTRNVTVSIRHLIYVCQLKHKTQGKEEGVGQIDVVRTETLRIDEKMADAH